MPARQSLIALLAGLTVLTAPPARAQVACVVQVSPMSFGAINVIGPLPADRTLGTIVVQCSNGGATEANLLIDVGLSAGASGSESERRMTGPNGATIAYDLFRDAGRRNRWMASGNPAASMRVPANGTASLQFTAFGRVYGPSSAPPGVYSDVLMTSIAF